VIERAAELLHGRVIVALTGAGCSTESGIPDYRGEGTRRRARNPMHFDAYIADPAARARYWARSAVGWSRFSQAQANAAHHALASLERARLLRGIITQNVDRLHQAADSSRVVELHGALAEVRCLGCGAREPRTSVQQRILVENPGWEERVGALAPDGDADIPDEMVRDFRPPACSACGGVVRPGVVFFGENVPAPVVAEAYGLLAEGHALLVVGSSLAVFSGYRFVLAAARREVPIVIVNLGPTRGDPHARVCIDARAGEVLPKLTQALMATQI
jgi:NAD-dependent SIR2 family protein deacetylase